MSLPRCRPNAVLTCRRVATILLAVAIVLSLSSANLARQEAVPDFTLFYQAASRDDKAARAALDVLARQWRDGYAALIIDLARFMQRERPQSTVEPDVTLDDDEAGSFQPPGQTEGSQLAVRRDPSTIVRGRLLRFLERQTRRSFGDDLARWREWIWSLPYEPHPQYGRFKGELYGQIDPRMRAFFPDGVKSLIRLDEIDWGGVRVNGIPPLDHPKVLQASEAAYLKPRHIVFGIVVNGEARAYPKRIIAWHELVRDKVGGVELTIVYCTLCGTVIAYDSASGGVHRTFGTSGLLYRSNKLMFDEETSSLWSSMEGKPVVGRLAGSELQLEAHGVVTTTWEEWSAEHPDTTVLSLDTGFKRDYSEGAAYREYFATDALMFAVPKIDKRLKNKAEVLTFVLPRAADDKPRQPFAASAQFLEKNPVFQTTVAGRTLLIVTSRSGANRVYLTDATAPRFASRAADRRVLDAAGAAWRVTDEAIVLESNPSIRFPRLAAQRAFWFGWYAQFPDTVLVK